MLSKKSKYEPPTPKFPYKIPKRLNLLSEPHTHIIQTNEGMPSYTQGGVRKSAFNAEPNERITDVAWPYTRRLLITKKLNQNRFSAERNKCLDRMIEASNATCYAKFANFVIDLKKIDIKDLRKKRKWSESEWKKHMDYIALISSPKTTFPPPPIERGPRKPLSAFLPRIRLISMLPAFKIYKTLSKEDWYRNPEKVSPGALKYVISDRVKKLAVARVIHEPPG